MQAVILAGGLGTRLSEETELKPKPMVEIGGKPILWHIMKLYSSHGINEFIVCLGYKGYVIKEYFSNYFLHNSNVTFDLSSNSTSYFSNTSEPWKITLIDTGENTMTGGRIKRIENYIKNENFFLKYCDGLSDNDIYKTISFHLNKKKYATVTAIKQPGRFGVLDLDNDEVLSFDEKPKLTGGWINGGFFVLNKKIFDFIKSDMDVWENQPMNNLTKANQLVAFKHEGFWHPMDTLRDKRYLEELWSSNNTPWRKWE